jgi:chromosome partitioning protein
MRHVAGEVLALYALKGGVGKTSAAVNLAYLAAAEGKRTVLWDLDPQGGATFLTRVKPKLKGGARALLQGETDPADVVRESTYENLSVLPAETMYGTADVDLDAAKKSERRVERIADQLAETYDLVVIDCPPGMSLLSVNIVRGAGLLLVPLIPSPLSLRTLDQVVDTAASVGKSAPAVLAFLSMYDRRRALHRDVFALVEGRYGDVARTVIPVSATAERMAQRRAPVAAWAPTSPVSVAYEALWSEIKSRLEQSSGKRAEAL